MLRYIGDGTASRVHWQKYHSIRTYFSVPFSIQESLRNIVSMRYEGKQETEENKKKKEGNKRAARGNGKEVEKEKEKRFGDEPKSRGRHRGGSPRKEREEIWNRN